jgi:ferredoxin-type protein NapH
VQEGEIMKNKKQPKLTAYLSGPVSIVTGFILAALFFMYILKDPSPVPIFIIFATIEAGGMLLYGVLPHRFKNIVRMVSMFIIGSFLFFLAGVLSSSNYQLEGFLFYLFSGTVSGAIVHYMMAKIIGPIFFSRNWCSWGCWTSFVFDLLPYKNNIKWNSSKSGKLRYVHFLVSVLVVASLFFGIKYGFVQTNPEALKNGMGTAIELTWFILGNLFYYLVGIFLAIKYKDNRAFCKYLCPVTVFLKLTTSFTLLRIKGDAKKCTNCNTCVRNCPMAINIPKYLKEKTRVKSTECIMCLKCISVCPEAILKTSVGFDLTKNEYLKS